MTRITVQAVSKFCSLVLADMQEEMIRAAAESTRTPDQEEDRDYLTRDLFMDDEYGGAPESSVGAASAATGGGLERPTSPAADANLWNGPKDW